MKRIEEDELNNSNNIIRLENRLRIVPKEPKEKIINFCFKPETISMINFYKTYQNQGNMDMMERFLSTIYETLDFYEYLKEENSTYIPKIKWTNYYNNKKMDPRNFICYIPTPIKRTCLNQINEDLNLIDDEALRVEYLVDSYLQTFINYLYGYKTPAEFDEISEVRKRAMSKNNSKLLQTLNQITNKKRKKLTAGPIYDLDKNDFEISFN